MMKLWKNIRAAAAICLIGSSMAANELSDLMKMNALYGSKQELYMEFDITMTYANFHKKEEKQACILVKDNSKTYYKVMQIEYLNDDTYSLLVDHEQRLLVIDQSLKADETTKLMNKLGVSDMGDTTKLKAGYVVRYTDKQHHTIRLKPKSPTSEFEWIDIVLNSDYSLSRVSYSYRDDGSEGPKVTYYDVVYRKLRFKSEPRYLNAAKFIHPGKGALKPTGAIAAYRVVDKRKKTH